MKNKVDNILMWVIIGGLFLFAAVNALHPVREMSEKENRELAKFPETNTETIFNGQFMDDFETYAADQFLFRDGAVSLKADSEMLIGKKGCNGVHFGRDSYLIARPDKYDEENLEKNLQSVTEFGDTGLFNVTAAIVPTGYEIMQNKLPKYAYQRIIPQITEYIGVKMQDGAVKICDTTDILKSHNDEYIYYRTDHHQTALGSYYVYSALGEYLDYEPFAIDEFNREVLSDSFLGTSWSKASITFEKNDSIEKFTLDRDWLEQTVDLPVEGRHMNTLYAEEHLATKDKYATYLDGNHAVEVIRSNVGTGRKLAVFKDSYAHSIVPFLANHFDVIHMIDLRYYNDDMIQYLSDNKITDVLILYNSEGFMTDKNVTKLGEFSETSSVFDPPPPGFLPETDRVDDAYFADAAFLGDSITAGFSNHADIPAKFYCKASSDTKEALTNSIGGSPILQNMLDDREVSKYYILYGLNEVSFRPVDEYIDNYKQIIAKIREVNPTALIYIESVLPVEHKVETKTNISKAKIDAYNEALVELAETEGCYYLNINGCLAEEDGYLRDGAASDGMHVGSKDHRKWEDYLRTHAVFSRKKNAEVKTVHVYSGGGKTNLQSFADEMLAGVPFRENLSPIKENIVARTYHLEEGEVLNGIVYASGGATSEEFAAFETSTPEQAQALSEKIKQRIEERKADFEGYKPEEMPNLNNPVIIVDDCLVAMCISDDNGAAETVISHY